MANLAHPADLTRPRALNLNSAAAGVAAGCLMSLGSPFSFAAERGAMLNDGLTPGDLILLRYLVAGPLMLPVLIYFGVPGLAGIGWDGFCGATGPKVWLGDLLFLAAAVAWALFSVLVRRWRVDALRAITVVSVLSAAVIVPGYLAVFGTAHVVALPRGALLAQALL